VDFRVFTEQVGTVLRYVPIDQKKPTEYPYYKVTDVECGSLSGPSFVGLDTA
jgi:hypothetical protein